MPRLRQVRLRKGGWMTGARVAHTAESAGARCAACRWSGGGAGAPVTRRLPESLLIPDAAAWRAWLDEHEDANDGVWVVLAKKGTTHPTSLSYAQALEEALCSGWIDGRKNAVDDATFRQHFTRRRSRSLRAARIRRHLAALGAGATAGQL